VAQRLREQGFENAFGLRGGFAAWIEAGGPVEPRDG
jgi:rhodanese-related sulfurtransferase